MERRELVERLQRKVGFGDFEKAVLGSADALDAVHAAFAGMAAAIGPLAQAPTKNALLEGWIALASAPPSVVQRATSFGSSRPVAPCSSATSVRSLTRLERLPLRDAGEVLAWIAPHLERLRGEADRIFGRD